MPLLTIIGFLSSNLLTRPLMQLADQQFDRFPLIKLFHSSLKDLLGAFVGKKKRFNRPVLVSAIPESDLKFVGFVTCATMETWGLKDQVAVYIPAAFNFGGNLVVVPKESRAAGGHADARRHGLRLLRRHRRRAETAPR